MRVAALQMVSQHILEDNLAAAGRLLVEAAGQGAQLAVLPENFAYFGQGNLHRQGRAESLGQGVILPFLAEQARRHGLWIAGGTIPLAFGVNGQEADDGKAFASCCIINPLGELVARYDKIHLFDAGVNDAIGVYRESSQLTSGSLPGVVDTPWAKLGLSVCYDLRFPEYYRLLSAAGAQILLVPSAFVYTTGQAHWEVLLRARAIENQCFVIAANQGGLHSGNRRTWGQSMVINPWGDVIAQAREGEAVVVADLDLAGQVQLRERMPVLGHRRF